MARCILHVGTHKTGTTTVQTILKQRQIELRGKGFYYPVIGDKRNHNFLAHQLAACSEKELSKIKQLLNGSVGSINNRDDCLILSAEEFSTRICSVEPWQGLENGYEEKRRRYLDRLKFVLSDFDAVDTFICFREHEEYAHSLYATKVLSGKVHTSLIEFVTSCAPIFNYSLQKNLFQCFGHIHVKRYEDMNDSLESKFVSWLGLPEGDATKVRLRRTPPIELIYWLSQSAQSGIKSHERESRAEFCRSFSADETHIELVAESLWESEDDRNSFLRSCISEDGSIPQLKGRPVNRDVLTANQAMFEELYAEWLKNHNKGFSRLFSFLR